MATSMAQLPRPKGVTPARDTLPALYLLFLRNQATRGRLVLLGGLGFMGVLMGVAIRMSDRQDPISDATKFIDGFGLVLLVPITSLVFASSTFGDVTDDKTLVYLWLRPVRRLHVAAAAAAASLTVCLPLVAFPLVLAAMTAQGGPALVGGTAVAVLSATTGYVGIFTWLGLRFRRALVWGLVYIMLWEGFVASAGKSASKLALRAYSRSILSGYTGVELKLATLPMWVGVIVPIVVGFIAVILAGRRLARQDVD
jgi:ABC-2 type transport system permease protein